jgi:hypothetical protein
LASLLAACVLDAFLSFSCFAFALLHLLVRRHTQQQKNNRKKEKKRKKKRLSRDLHWKEGAKFSSIITISAGIL